MRYNIYMVINEEKSENELFRSTVMTEEEVIKFATDFARECLDVKDVETLDIDKAIETLDLAGCAVHNLRNIFPQAFND